MARLSPRSARERRPQLALAIKARNDLVPHRGVDRVEPDVLSSGSNAAAAQDLIDGLGHPDRAVFAQLLDV